MKQIGTLGTIDTITVGGRVLTNLASLITLNAILDGTNANWSTFRASNASAGYQVTAGKTLALVGANFSIVGAAASSGGILLYGDTDVTLSSGSAPTNPVYIFGDDPGVGVPVMNGTADGIFGMALNFSIPSAKYPAVFSQGAVLGYIQIFGYEV